MIESGIKRVSISIDGKNAASHDNFRQEKGAFDKAMTGIAALKEAGMEFQINTTITTANLKQIKDILELAKKLGAAAHHIFLLVPTGRGKELAGQAITAADYERNLNVVSSRIFELFHSTQSHLRPALLSHSASAKRKNKRTQKTDRTFS